MNVFFMRISSLLAVAIFSTLSACGGDSPLFQADDLIEPVSCATPTGADTVFNDNNCLECHSAQLNATLGGSLNLESPSLGQDIVDRIMQH